MGVTLNNREPNLAVVKGFFFDLDGTLVDTHESNFRAYRQAANEIVGITLGSELKNHIRNGESSKSFLRTLLPSASPDNILAINSRKKEIYPEHLDVSRLNNYLSSFLVAMSEHYVTALVTTAKRQNALAAIEKHGLDKYFTFMIFGDEVKKMKPDPEVYRIALRKSGLRANEVLAFEDSFQGIAAAEAAGIQTVHIRNFE